MDPLTDAGLGLGHGELRFARTTPAWIAVGEELRQRVAAVLGRLAVEVDVIGSSAVLGLLAKPVIDLAAGITPIPPLAPARAALEGAGWIYRGDAGADGGHVFVLEARASFRVAHLHLVEHEGEQWRRYLLLRDLLRRDPEARRRYEAVKRQLRQQVGHDRIAYTQGKTAVVHDLLAGIERHEP